MSHLFDLKTIKNFVGSAYFLRGKDYFDRHRIYDISLENNVLRGKVKGLSNNIYSVLITLNLESIADSDCTCPIGWDCKHVAALYLEAMQNFGQTRSQAKLERIERKQSKIESSLRPFSAFVQPESDVEDEQRNLEIILKIMSVATFPDAKPNLFLQVRPRIFNKQTSTFSTTSWVDVKYNLSSGLPKKQEIFLKQIVLALFDYSPSKNWLTVNHQNAELFWFILHQHGQNGVQIIDSTKAATPINVSAEPIQVAFELTDIKGHVSVRQKFMLAGEEISPDNCFMIGNPPVFAAFSNTPFEQSGNVSFSLHPVESLSRRLTHYDGDVFRNPVQIPKSDFETFQKQVLPKLVKNYQVVNLSTKVTVPKFLSPTFVVKISSTETQNIDVQFRYLYENHSIALDALEQTFSLKGAAFLRSTEEEQLLIRQALEIFSDLPSLRNTTSTFPTEVSLKKIEAARFLNIIVPKLQQLSNFKVELSENLPKFVLDETQPEIELNLEEKENSSDWFDLNIVVNVGGEPVYFQHLFAALSKNEQHVFLDSGRYFSLDNPIFDQLKKLIAESRGLVDQQSKGFTVSRFQAGLWEELSLLGVVKKQSQLWKKSMDGLLHSKGIENVVLSKKFLAKLRAYQHEGFLWLRFLRNHNLGGILADDMGLGKTLQTMAFIHEVCETNKKKSLHKLFLVIAPTSVVENWDMELQRFAPHLKSVIFRSGNRAAQHKALIKADIAVTSYALLVRDFKLFENMEFDTIILDEAQFVKNYQSKAYGLIRKLKSGSKIALTGTPMENNLMELWSIFSIVAPGLFGDPDHFQQHYRRAIEKMNDKEALSRLRKRIRPFILRRKKEVVAKDLPLKIEQTLFLEMNKEHRHIYDLHLQRERQRVLGMLKEGGLKEHRFQILAALTKMRQMCLHPVLVDPKHKNVSSTKLEALKEHLETLLGEGRRVLIFSQFTSFLKEVREVLDLENMSYLYLDGATKNRSELLKKFHQPDGPPIFLISLKAGGFGLNLTAADYCILLDPWWNPAVESQAIDRTHRIGQTKQVFVYKMILKNSIEEKVLKLQEKKKQLFKNVLEEGEAFGSLITENDIRSIFE